MKESTVALLNAIDTDEVCGTLVPCQRQPGHVDDHDSTGRAHDEPTAADILDAEIVAVDGVPVDLTQHDEHGPGPCPDCRSFDTSWLSVDDSDRAYCRGCQAGFYGVIA